MTAFIPFLINLLWVAIWLMAFVGVLMAIWTGWEMCQKNYDALNEALPPVREFLTSWFVIVGCFSIDSVLWLPASITAAALGFVCLVRLHLTDP